MQWIRDFQLFLFDFDGLLVDTEPLHFQAYMQALGRRGLRLDLSFSDFQSLAHLNSQAWRAAVCTAFPSLDYEKLYQEKKAQYIQLLASSDVQLMRGAGDLLFALHKANIQRCVVTHSLWEHVSPLIERIPALKSIEHWVTRESYQKPKPDPECYLKAISLYAKKGDKVIGFEDSVRGLKALQGTDATAVLVCSSQHPLLDVAMQKGGIRCAHLGEVGDSILNLHEK